MPDAESETRACPYCKEEVNAAAVRCKNCLADIAAMRPDHGGVCPLPSVPPGAVACQSSPADHMPSRPRLGEVPASPRHSWDTWWAPRLPPVSDPAARSR